LAITICVAVNRVCAELGVEAPTVPE
jgi:hypothetical protein